MIILNIFKSQIIIGIIGSLIAGFLTIGIVESYKYYKLFIRQRKFIKVFGSYAKDKLFLIVPALSVRPDVLAMMAASNLEGNHFPLIKYGGAYVRSSKLLGYADVVALKYLLNIISRILGSKSIITTDEDLHRELDLSFISFGGTSFYCTYVINHKNNKFYTFDDISIKSLQYPNRTFQASLEHDYGFILKFNNDSLPTRTWIVIAGLGESGTRGAGWYLSTHWKQISEEFEDRPFGIVVRVDQNIDHSAVEADRTI